MFLFHYFLGDVYGHPLSFSMLAKDRFLLTPNETLCLGFLQPSSNSPPWATLPAGLNNLGSATQAALMSSEKSFSGCFLEKQSHLFCCALLPAGASLLDNVLFLKACFELWSISCVLLSMEMESTHGLDSLCYIRVT